MDDDKSVYGLFFADGEIVDPSDQNKMNAMEEEKFLEVMRGLDRKQQMAALSVFDMDLVVKRIQNEVNAYAELRERINRMIKEGL